MNEQALRRHIIVVGGSAGGIEALRGLLAAIPPDIPAVFAIVVHLNPFHDSVLPLVLSRQARIRVVQAVHRHPLEQRTAYIAPPDMHMRLSSGTVVLDRGPKAHRTRPAIDPLFISAADVYGPAVIGVVLSGQGVDGVTGLTAIKARGGLSLVQDPGEALHASMPRSAIERDHVDAVLPVAELAKVLTRLALGEAVELG